MNGGGETKREMALLAGFAPSTADNVHDKVEKTEGFKNAMIDLALKSQNLVVAALNEFEARGLNKFSDKDLISSLNAIVNAFDRIHKVREPHANKTPEGNPLRAAVLQHVENQTVVVSEKENQAPTIVKEKDSVEVPVKSTIVPQQEDKKDPQPFDYDL